MLGDVYLKNKVPQSVDRKYFWRVYDKHTNKIKFYVDGKNVKKHVFQVDSVNFTLDRNKTKLLLGFKSAIPITPDYYELLKQNIEVQACSPPRNMEDKDDELSAAFTGATPTWIDSLAERETYKGKELNRQLGFYDYDYDSRPRATLSQDKLFNGESPSVGNIKTQDQQSQNLHLYKQEHRG